MIATSRRRFPQRGQEGAGRIWLLTGPNMAGKSTFLRQNALIAILAQMGSFVPAKRAHIGIVDRLFSRVGAADDLARGRSTFMVEMVETAAILNQAGARSLVILDEIGRGTATFDGLSIAWATVEHLHDVNKCRALFATHFHELTALAARLARLHNATVRVKEWQGEVVFLHEVTAGAADRSYGIQVAKLAGLPARVIERAKIVLAKLEAEDRAAPKGFEDLPLFAAPPRPAQRTADDAYACCSPRWPRSIPTRCRRARRWKRSTGSRAGGQVARSACAGKSGLDDEHRRTKRERLAGSGASLARRASTPRCRRKTRPRRPSCSCRTGCGATCWPSPGRSRPSTGRAAIERNAARDACRAPSRATSTFRHSARRRAGSPAPAPNASRRSFEFETAFGPCNGVLRLVPDGEGRLRAWTLNTNLHELRGHEEEFKRRAPSPTRRATSARENWADRARAGSAPSPTAIRPC